MLRAFGRLPKRGEAATIGEFRFQVVRADSRRIYTLQVERVAAASGAQRAGRQRLMPAALSLCLRRCC